MILWCCFCSQRLTVSDSGSVYEDNQFRCVCTSCHDPKTETGRAKVEGSGETENEAAADWLQRASDTLFMEEPLPIEGGG